MENEGNAKLENLRKKYQAIEEDQAFVQSDFSVPEKEKKKRAKQPEQSRRQAQAFGEDELLQTEIFPQSDFSIDDEIETEVLMPNEAVSESEPDNGPAVKNDRLQDFKDYNESLGFGDFDEPQESGFGFFDEEPQAEQVKEEPKMAYDLNMFGSTVQKSFDVDSFDDSWLDSSLDESIFYTPQSAQKSGEAYAYEPAQAVTQTYMAEETSAEENLVAGGYIAPEEDESFSFDDEGADDFFEDDFGTDFVPEPDPSLEGLPVFTPAAPAGKQKSLEKKDEKKAVTGFSKSYKGESGKGQKKKGNFFTRNLIPCKGDSGAEILRKIVMVVAVIAAIGSAAYLFNDYVIAPYQNSKQMDELSGMIGDGNEVLDELSISEKYPGVDFPDGMLEKYAALYARNEDFVGWIEIDGLDISLPVVRAENNSKYLKTDFDGKASKYGSIFMNCQNDVQNLDYNTVLFGHYMKDTKMFGNLVEYKSASGYKKAPLIEFNTIYGDFKWKVFAVFITNGTEAGDRGYLFNYMFTDLSTPEAVEEFLGEIKLRSIYYPEVDIAVSDKLLTLSTCTYEFDEARLVIMARMVREGESTHVNTDNIRYNANPRYPAAYYKEKSLSNPYVNYTKWYPS